MDAPSRARRIPFFGQSCLILASVTEDVLPAYESNALTNSTTNRSINRKSQMKSEPQSTSSETIFESSTTSSDSGTGSSSPSGMKRASMEPQLTPDVLES